MPDQNYNPIRSVNGATIPCPSTYQWSVNDISDAEAGRTEDGKMHKNRIARKRKLELEWRNIPLSDVRKVLAAFSPEYVSVNCLDPLVGGYATYTFYSGDQAAPAYNVRIDAWTVSFDIIEQ